MTQVLKMTIRVFTQYQFNISPIIYQQSPMDGKIIILEISKICITTSANIISSISGGITVVLAISFRYFFVFLSVIVINNGIVTSRSSHK